MEQLHTADHNFITTGHGVNLGTRSDRKYIHYTVQCDVISDGNSWIIDTFREAIFVFVPSYSHFLFRTCLIMWFISLWKVSVFKLFRSDCITLYTYSIHCVHIMFIRVAQKTAISVKNSMTEGKKSLSDVGFENIFVFLILFIPRSSNCKKPFRGFL